MINLRFFIVIKDLIINYIKSLFGYSLYIRLFYDDCSYHFKIDRIGFNKYRTEFLDYELMSEEFKSKFHDDYKGYTTTFKTFKFIFKHSLKVKKYNK
jgi:hypothetical protein